MRKVESVHQFTHDPKYRLAKEKVVIRCDDSTVYEFEQATDQPNPRLVRAFQPDRTMTHTSSNILPSAVEETVSTVISGWSK